jgi:hypothetical protein
MQHTIASPLPAVNIPPPCSQVGGKLLYYTCPMPEPSDVHQNKPGKCPKCGMTLIPVMEAPPLQNAATNQIRSRE